MRQTALWGRFSVLGHLTLPLRYMNERRGFHATFDGFEEEMEEIFRILIRQGRGIEVNTNRGHQPLPGEKWLRMYRDLGGEIVTLGSDAHATRQVGCAIREGQALLLFPVLHLPADGTSVAYAVIFVAYVIVLR